MNVDQRFPKTKRIAIIAKFKIDPDNNAVKPYNGLAAAIQIAFPVF